MQQVDMSEGGARPVSYESEPFVPAGEPLLPAGGVQTIQTVNLTPPDLETAARDFITGPQGATAGAVTMTTTAAASAPQQQQSDELPSWALPVGLLVALLIFGNLFGKG